MRRIFLKLLTQEYSPGMFFTLQRKIAAYVTVILMCFFYLFNIFLVFLSFFQKNID